MSGENVLMRCRSLSASCGVIDRAVRRLAFRRTIDARSTPNRRSANRFSAAFMRLSVVQSHSELKRCIVADCDHRQLSPAHK